MSYQTVTVGGVSIETYGAKMHSGPGYCRAVDSEVFQGVNRSTYAVLKNRRGKAVLRCLVDFFGSREERALHQSNFEALFRGMSPTEINIGDGFTYRAILSGTAENSTVGEYITTCEYSFIVTRNKARQTVSVVGSSSTTHLDGGWIDCSSNVEKTDCVITITVTFDGNHTLDIYLFGANGQITGEWKYELSGTGPSVVVIDGENKRILADGVNVTGNFTWSDFPWLTPGRNAIAVTFDTVAFAQPVEVAYTPAFL